MTKFRFHGGAVYGQNVTRSHDTRATAPSFTPIRKVWPFLARLAQTVQTESTATCKSTELHKTRSTNVAVPTEIKLVCCYSVADTVPTGMKHTNTHGVQRCTLPKTDGK